MEWHHVEPLQAETLIEEYEALIGYTFPEDFRAFAKQYNGGRPEKLVFRSVRDGNAKKRVFGDVLSFNKDVRGSFWSYNRWFIPGAYDDWIAQSGGEIRTYAEIGFDGFGNLICYDIRTNELVWIDHEQPYFSRAVEQIAPSWTAFVRSLRTT